MIPPSAFDPSAKGRIRLTLCGGTVNFFLSVSENLPMAAFVRRLAPYKYSPDFR